MIYEGKFTISGRPVTKKNNLTVAKGGKILPSFAYRKWEPHAIRELEHQWGGKPSINRPVLVRVKYWMQNKQGWPDLIGLLQATCDVLERSGIVENDRLVVSFSQDTRIEGIDMLNSRTEIELYTLYRDDDVTAYELDPWIIKREKDGEYDDFRDVAEAHANRKRRPKKVRDSETP